ncbi:MAG: acetate--CoA ligase family protein [Desulfobacteraceae bacterium]
MGRTFHDFQAIGSHETEVLVQSMVSNGREVILGGKHDDVFGPVVLFGLGGVFVEALEDVVWRVAPINHDVARQMIHGIKGSKILGGLRGEKPYDVGAVADLLVRLSQMLVDLPLIQEIDINPVMVFQEGQGAQAVDARVILKGKAQNEV